MNQPLEKCAIGFIGGGAAAHFMLHGLRKRGIDPGSVTVAEPDESRRAFLAGELGVKVTADNADAARGCDLLVLAVKPQVMIEVLEPLALEAEPASERALVISLAAGISTMLLQRWLGADWPVVRVMPNTPAQIGAGVAGLYASPQVSDRQREQAFAFAEATGAAVWVPNESLMDVVTAISGSGPAYFFLLTELLQNTGVQLGLDADTAAVLARKTALGAARMLDETGQAPEDLRKAVTSPGGTTERALEIMHNGGFDALFAEGVIGAALRGRELALELEND